MAALQRNKEFSGNFSHILKFPHSTGFTNIVALFSTNEESGPLLHSSFTFHYLGPVFPQQINLPLI